MRKTNPFVQNRAVARNAAGTYARLRATKRAERTLTFPTFGGRDDPPGNIARQKGVADHGRSTSAVHAAVQGAGGEAGGRGAGAHAHGAGAGHAAQHADALVEEGGVARKPEPAGPVISE